MANFPAKHISLLLFSLFLILSTLEGQVNTVVINEKFNDNSNYWDIQDEPESMLKISNGQYFMKGKMLGRAITSTINTTAVDNEDFKISVRLTKINGIDDNGFGIIWGSKDENNEYEFVISGNGQFKVIEWKDGTKKDLVRWTFYSNIQKWDNATNLLRIEKRAEFVKFFINDNYVAIVGDIKNQGNRIGFVINETMEVKFDYLIYEKIEQEYSINQQTDMVSIMDISFPENKDIPELKYSESTVLKIILENKANDPVNDLALMISISNNQNIEFDRINMISVIPAHDRTILSVTINADEELETLNRDFSIILTNGKNEILDTKTIMLKTVGRGNYYVENVYKDKSNKSPTSTTKKNYSNNSADGCTKGCSYATLGALMIALLLAII